MGKMIDTYAAITKRVGGGNKSVIDGETFTVTADCRNDYYTDQLQIIPAGTKIIADFAGEFGMYGLVEVCGALHKVKIKLHELHNVDFGTFDARNNIVEIAA